MGNVAAQLAADFGRAHTKAVAGWMTRKYPARGATGINYIWIRGATGDHAKGKAVDFMTLTDDQTRLQVAMGQAIADELWARRAELGVHYVIYRQRIISIRDNDYGDAGVWNRMEDRGNPTKNHMDHVHGTFVDNPPQFREPGREDDDDMPTLEEYAAAVWAHPIPWLNGKTVSASSAMFGMTKWDLQRQQMKLVLANQGAVLDLLQKASAGQTLTQADLDDIQAKQTEIQAALTAIDEQVDADEDQQA